MKQRSFSFLAFLLILGSGLFPGRAAAGSLLLGSTGNLNFSSGDFTFGYSFTVGPDQKLVASLGIYDVDQFGVVGAGLKEAHDVGLWAPDGTLLASVIVPSGTAGTLVNGYRYANLATPFLLLSGQTYLLGARYPTRTDSGFEGLDIGDPSEMAALTASGFTYDTGRYTTAAGFAFPANANFFGYSGPNLLTSEVPEPSTLLLLVAGGGTALMASRMRRRRS